MYYTGMSLSRPWVRTFSRTWPPASLRNGRSWGVSWTSRRMTWRISRASPRRQLIRLSRCSQYGRSVHHPLIRAFSLKFRLLTRFAICDPFLQTIQRNLALPPTVKSYTVGHTGLNPQYSNFWNFISQSINHRKHYQQNLAQKYMHNQSYWKNIS